MQSAGLLCSRTLIEVARILVQKRGDESASNHDRRELVGIAGAKSLAETLSTPNVGGGPCRLPGSSNHGHAGRGKRVSDGSEGEMEFKLRIERRGIGIVYCEKIGDDVKSAVLARDLYLLNGHLIGAFGGKIGRASC